MTEQEEKQFVENFTEIMREADQCFEKIGGSTRHYVRDCLLPIIQKKGFKITLEKLTDA
jgi:hypothetical protein